MKCPDEGIILTEGYSDGNFLNDVWRSVNRGATWTRMTAAAGWAGQRAHSAYALKTATVKGLQNNKKIIL